MEYTVKTLIHRNIDTVVGLFSNVENLPKWMEGLQSYKLISGEIGKPGAQSKMQFLIGKRKMEMLETILEQNLPNKMICTYTTAQADNKIEISFRQIDEQNTEYISFETFTFKGTMKFWAWMLKSLFKKQSQKYLNSFKHFCESQ